MADTVHVRGVEVECRCLRPRDREALECPVSQLEPVFDQIPGADVHGARRNVMIVQTGLLLICPADQPDIDMEIAMKLDAVAFAAVVSHERPPRRLVSSDGERERA
jgi:hypothetical protein